MTIKMVVTMAAALGISVGTATLATAQVATNPLTGDWRTDDGKAIVRIAPCGAALCGRVARLLVAEPAGGARDTHNPDPALRSRPVVGVEIFSGLTRHGAAWQGQGYSPEMGRRFNATLTPVGDRLTVRGCVAIFCQTQTMTRAR